MNATVASHLLEDGDDPKDWIMSHDRFWDAPLERMDYKRLHTPVFVSLIKKYVRPKYTINVLVNDPPAYGGALKWQVELRPRQFPSELLRNFFTRPTDSISTAEKLDKIIERICTVSELGDTDPGTLIGLITFQLRQHLARQFTQDNPIFENRASVETRLVPRNSATGLTVGVDVVLEINDRPVWIGFLKPRGNTWRIASFAHNLDSRDLDRHFSTAKAAAEYLVRAAYQQ